MHPVIIKGLKAGKGTRKAGNQQRYPSTLQAEYCLNLTGMYASKNWSNNDAVPQNVRG